MGENEYNRKRKEKNPVLAICYDFDKTLSPKDMQAQGFIQSIKYDIKEFWTKSNGMASDNDMDQNLAYMYLMVTEAKGENKVTKENLEKYGADVVLFRGVKEWFNRIRDYGEKHGVIVEHYIISSGIKEMIEGTEIAKKGFLEKIYASSFYFDEEGVAKWPAQVVNYTNKTQFLFRIEKGILDINDPGVNDFFPPDELRVPFRNIIYIGDSDTDIPCMKLVNSYGGYSIGVYDPQSRDKEKVYKMICDNRIKYFAPADYSENEELDLLVKSIIDRTAANEKLESAHYNYYNEAVKAENEDDRSEEDHIKDDLISNLSKSGSFRYTHFIIEDLNSYDNWNKNQLEKLFKIANENGQVSWILEDEDIKEFYLKLLKKCDFESEDINRIRNKLDKVKF